MHTHTTHTLHIYKHAQNTYINTYNENIIKTLSYIYTTFPIIY